LDLTLLDSHFGTIDEWRYAIDEIHKRGMYVVLENTMSTMGDLIGFEGYLNETTPFSFTEHNAVWKSSRRYWDFHLGDDSVPCEYPRFWDEQGKLVGEEVTSKMTTCRTSDFDQVGCPLPLPSRISLPSFLFLFVPVSSSLSLHNLARYIWLMINSTVMWRAWAFMKSMSSNFRNSASSKTA
jgi:hypothetical protein